jgi:erythromycin esterase-like protein
LTGRARSAIWGVIEPLTHTAAVNASLDEWVEREAIPFSLDSGEGFDSAVDRVVVSVGDSVELLGLGEALHGGEEILVLRNRLFGRLVEAHGFSAIAVESSFSRGRLVNEYVCGGAGTYADVRDAGFGHGFGRLEANRELVEWMRGYNSDPARRVGVRFYGFDMPGVEAGPASPREVLGFVLEYLGSMDGEAARGHRERIEPHLGSDSDWQNPMVWREPAKSGAMLASLAALRVETEELISTLRTGRPGWVAGSDEGRYGEALHYGSVARQLLNFFAALAGGADYAASLGVRDAMMAENLEYIVSRERGRGKVLAFAHNKHLQRGKAQWRMGPGVCAWWPAGSHLHEIFGSRYAVIGSAVGVSGENGIGRPEEGTLEAMLTAAAGPARLIPTLGGRGCSGTLPVRSGSARNPTYFPLTAESLIDFDWLVALDSVVYNRGGRPLP